MYTFKQFLVEGPENYTERDIQIAKKIVRECSQYLNEHTTYHKYPLYRGMKSGPAVVAKKKVRLRRKPTDTPPLIQKMIDDWFKKEYGAEFRKQGLFTTGQAKVLPGSVGSDVSASQYGTPYVIFPIGYFDYVWARDKKFSDLYGAVQTLLDKLVSKRLDKIIRTKQQDPTSPKAQSWADGLEGQIEDAIYGDMSHLPRQNREILEPLLTDSIDELMKKANFTDQKLSGGIRSGHEVMIVTREYYAFNYKVYHQKNFGKLIKAVHEGNIEEYI